MATLSDRLAWVRWVRALLWACAVVCFGWVGGVSATSVLFDWQAREAFHSGSEGARATVGASYIPVVGILEIPRLGFSEVVAEGDTESELRVAIGHLPDTPLPWQPGNSALAAHRDGRFRALKDVRVGDRLRLETHQGTLNYVLRETVIVEPDDVWVLNPTSNRTLTLITCYPFEFIGPAPKRFVIRAETVLQGER